MHRFSYLYQFFESTLCQILVGAVKSLKPRTFHKQSTRPRSYPFKVLKISQKRPKTSNSKVILTNLSSPNRSHVRIYQYCKSKVTIFDNVYGLTNKTITSYEKKLRKRLQDFHLGFFFFLFGFSFRMVSARSTI